MRDKIVLILLICMIFSCETLLFEADKASQDPFEIYDYLWDQLDKKYSYFELKQLDWDAVYEQYRADLHEGMSEDALFDVLASMMRELRDDHSNLRAPFDVFRYDLAIQKEDNFYARTLIKNYFTNYSITGSFIHDFIANNRLAYIRYSSFSSPVDKDAVDFLLERYKNTEGLVLDLRENGGGAVFNIAQLLERFSNERRLVANYITRNGPGRSDFSEKAPFHIGSHDGIRYEKPVVVLIDRGSYSATSMFALATKAFPNITLLGDTTGGGGGLPAGGQLPNGWTYRFSISQVLDLDDNNYTEDGVPPDIAASFDWSDLDRDEILDSAIDVLLNP